MTGSTDVEQVVPLNGCELWCRLVGPSTAPRLAVQAPGWGLGSRYLEQALAPLEASYRVLYHDPRGSGRSSRAVDPSTLNTGQMAEDLSALATAVGWSDYDLLGHSHGAFIALAHAVRRPERVRRLVLISPLVEPTQHEHDLIAALRRAEADPDRADAAAAWQELTSGGCGDDVSRHWRRLLPLYFHDLRQLDPDAPGMAPSDLSLAHYATVIAGDPRHVVTDQLHRLPMPVLVIAGQDDQVTPPTRAQALSEALPQATLLVLPHCAHYPWLEAPENFYQTLSYYLVSQN